jgi:hypothetical protein
MRALILMVGTGLLGSALFGLSLIWTHSPQGSVNGYPLTINHPFTPCFAPNPFTGFGSAYDTSAMMLDFLFWAAVGSILSVSSALILASHGAKA